MFSSESSSSISLATVTPSLVIVGLPNFFSMTTFRPLRAESDLDGVRKHVDAAKNRLSRILSVNNLLGHVFLLHSSKRVIMLDLAGIRGALDDAENLVLAHDEELFAVKLDFGTRVLSKEHPVAGLHVRLDASTVLKQFALANGDDFALLGLFFRRIGNVKAGGGLRIGLGNPPYDHAIVERPY